ncbi:MAG: response regulator [Actinomycetota bacterium]
MKKQLDILSEGVIRLEGWLDLYRDELEREQNEAVMERERWERSFAQVGEGMFILDKDFTILQCNAAFVELLGEDSMDLIGRKCYEVVHGLTSPALFCYTCSALKEGRSAKAELYEPFLGKHLEVASDPVLDDEGNLLYAIHLIRDITERKRLAEMEKELAAVEAAKKNAQKNARELSDMLTVASHELRHPATIFKGYSHILLENANDLSSDVIRDALMSIDSASDRLARTVNQLMDASRIDRGGISLKHEEFEPHTLLNRVTAEFQGTGANINTSDKTGECAVFKADREKLKSVLGNLVENAIKFSPDGSPVEVCVEAAPGGLLFSVCDDGPGISEEHAELVFERFYRVEEVEHHSIPGMGLGLHIVKTIVDEHGGWIRYRPGEGGGSVFEFFIPEQPKAELCPETEHEHVKAELSPPCEPRPPDESRDDEGLNDDDVERVLKVAVIDDDPDIVKMSMMLLKSRGYEAIAAYSGEEGLVMVNRETPDVVLLDIMMPGLDGIETCRRLKSDESTRDIPVIFVTAKTSEEFSEEALTAGGSAFLSKPFRTNELFETIENIRCKKVI